MLGGAVLALIVLTPAEGAADARVRGVVRDGTGSPVASASVVPAGASLPEVRTAPDGTFSFAPGAVRQGSLVVRAEGFAEVVRAWSVADPQPVLIVLTRLRRAEEVTVTAARGVTRLSDTAARVVILDLEELAGVLAVDEALRQVPGFSLFRRSGSRVANPTAQGASLRGVGPSGASRTLVLLDGVPLNDPFGGWVYWSRVPLAAVERIEVLEGGASDLYGSAALGGVVQVLGRVQTPAVLLDAWAGDRATAGVSTYAGGHAGAWSARLAAEAATTDGYVQVSEPERGAADARAGSRHLGSSLSLERRVGSGATAFVRGGLFGESRGNGTPLQVNDTEWKGLSGGGYWVSRLGTVSLRGWHESQTYRQSFSAVAADRASESLTRRQWVPSRAGGFSLQWSGALGARHALLAGAEGKWVRGRSDETAFAQARPTASSRAGGRQGTVAAFVVDRVALGPRVLVTLGVRADRWTDADGSVSLTPLATGRPSVERHPDRQRTVFSPRASVLLRAPGRLGIMGAAYGAFRGPTLNELYRSFRVGDTITLANAGLVEERLQGVEAGLSWSSAAEALRLRLVAFGARVEDPVANVTVGQSAGTTMRQRQNLGRTRSRGVTLDAELRFGRSFEARLGYAHVDAVVARFPASPDLEGLDLAQVPPHQVTLQACWRSPRIGTLTLRGRASSGQFEDDRNALVLPGYVTVDLAATRRLGARLSIFGTVENLTGERYAVGLTPVATLGPPRLVRAGIRLDWGPPRPSPGGPKP